MQTRPVNSSTQVNGSTNQVSQGANATDAKLKAARQQFEAVLWNQMLDAMQETVLDDGVSGDSSSNDIFTSMLNQQYATILAGQDSSPNGLSGILYQQMSGTPNIQPSAPTLPQSSNPSTVAGEPTLSALMQNLQYYLANGMLPTSAATGAPTGGTGSSNQGFNTDQIASALQGYGLSPNDATRLSGVINQESGGNPSAIYDKRDTTGEYSVGLFQINIGSDGANLPFVEQLSGLNGLDSNATWLQDPQNNIYTAAKLFQQYGYQPWKGNAAVWA
jgi:Rod binding domain-containing protein